MAKFNFRDWFNERYGKAQPILDLLVNKAVPLHKHSVWYYFGGLTLFFFGVQVLTGILLLLYYQPSADTAYESVRYIMTQVPFGWLIRSIHSWSANLFIGSLFIHMFSVFFLKSYRKPRELTWVTGALMLFIALGFGFTGYLLPWNELAFFATKVGTDITAVVPVVGPLILRFLRGGEEVTGGTLTRLFGFHVAVLPALALLVLGLHLALIQVQGMSVPLSVEKHGGHKKEISFFPDFLLRDLVGWLLGFALLVTLAVLFPWELGTKADPLAPAPPGIRPEWYFLFMFQTLKFVPGRVLWMSGEVLAILGFGAVGTFWLLVPFLDRWSARGERSPIFTTIGVLGLAFMIVMTVLAYVLPTG